MSIKTVLFFFLIFCCIIIPIFGIVDHYFIMNNLKKDLKNKEEIKNIIP